MMKFGSASIASSRAPADTPAHYDEWLIEAQPGARVPYAVGICLTEGCPADVAERMRELSAHGLVRLHQMPIGRPGGACRVVNYIAVRTQRPVPKGFPALIRTTEKVVTSGMLASSLAAARAERERKRIADDKAEIALFKRRDK